MWPQEVPSRGGKDVEWWPAEAKYGLKREGTRTPEEVKGVSGGAGLNLIPNEESVRRNKVS